MGERTDPGWWERAFMVVGLLLTTGAILSLVRVNAAAGTGAAVGELDPAGDPIKQAIFLAIYAVALVLLVWRCGLGVVMRYSTYVWVIVGIAAFSVLWSVDPSLSLRRVLALAGTTIFGTYLGVVCRPARLFQVITTTFVLAVVLCLIAAAALPQIAITFDGRSSSWNGIFEQKNMLGQYMAVAAFAFALRYRQAVRERRSAWWAGRWAWALAFCAASGLLLLSTSKTALVVAVIMFLCFPLVRLLSAARRRNSSLLIGSSTMMVAAVLGGVIAAWQLYTPITLALGRDPTLTGRTYVWHAVIDAISTHPWLGYGYSAFWGGLDSPAASIWAQTSSLMLGLHVTQSHNGWLDLLVQLGVIGLLAYLVMLVKLVGWSLRSAMRSPSTGIEMFTLAFCAYLLAYNAVESRTLDQNSFPWVMVCAFMAQRGIAREAVTRRELARTRGSDVRPDRQRFPSRTTPVAAHQLLDDLA